MKKFIMAISLWGIINCAQAQNWEFTGNTITQGSYLGTNNNEALIFKSNSNEGLRIKPNGELRIKNFDDNLSNGVVWVNSNGILNKLNFTGNTTDVLLGNGTFGSVTTLSGWSISGNVLFSDLSKNVAIGTNIAPEKLTVAGNIIASGSISGTSLNVIDIVTTGKEFKISTSLCMKGIDVNDPNSKNEICGMNGDLFIQSVHNNNHNTILNYGNSGKVGIGIIPTEDFHVGVDAKFEGNLFSKDLWTNRIRSESSDKTIYIGDSTILIDYGHNFITNNAGSYFYQGNINVKGLTIAPTAGGSITSIATGAGSLTLGNFLQNFGTGSMMLGKGINGATPLKNFDNFTFKVGFNSDLATFTVTNSNGVGTTGNVGIGTESPNSKFHVHQEVDPLIGGYGILSTSNSPTVKSISVIHKAPGNDQENFIVYTDGRVYCREVFVKLGQL